MAPLRRSSLQVLDPSPSCDASRALVSGRFFRSSSSGCRHCQSGIWTHSQVRRAHLHCARALIAVSFPRLVAASVIILELFLQLVRSSGQLCPAKERPLPRGPRQGSRLTSSTLNSADRLPRATWPLPFTGVLCRLSLPTQPQRKHFITTNGIRSAPSLLCPSTCQISRPLLGKPVFLHDWSNGTRSAQMGRRVPRDESSVVACVCRALPEFPQMWGPPHLYGIRAPSEPLHKSTVRKASPHSSSQDVQPALPTLRLARAC